MSVEYLVCDNCGEIFADCSHYVSCTCGNKWCCDECAEDDGFCVEVDTKEEYSTSCAYCRGEKYPTEELLNKALVLLGLTQEELIDKIKYMPNAKIQWHFTLDIIEDMEITQDEFATRMGITENALSRLIKGQVNISNDLAKKLSVMLGTSVEVWQNLQNAYDQKQYKGEE